MKFIFAIYCYLALYLVTVKCDVRDNMKNNDLRKRICSARPEYGLCEGSRRLWFYNPSRNRCEVFNYSNCGGNRNRFFREETCINFCKKKIRS